MALTQIDDRGLKTPIDLIDNEKIRLGTGNDLELYHDASNSFTINNTGNYLIKSTGDVYLRTATNEDAVACKANGSVELYYDNSKKFETISSGVRLSGPEAGEVWAEFYADEGDDNADKWRMGASVNTDLFIQNYASGSWETNIKAIGNGAVELYYDNSKKFETTSAGTTTTGNHVVVGLVACDGLLADDNEKIKLGSGEDFQIWHQAGSHSQIADATGHQLYLTADNAIYLQSYTGSENYIKCVENGAVELYYDGSKKLATTSGGVHIYNALNTSGAIGIGNGANLTFEDNGKAVFGFGSDLEIYHDGGNSYISDTGTGSLILRTGRVSFNDTGNNEMGRFDGEGLKFNGDSAAANALDDYEEGGWNPAISSGVTSASFITQYGRYTKIGNKVTVWFYIVLNGGSTTSSTFAVSLPFTPVGSTMYTAFSGYNNLSANSIDNPVLIAFPAQTNAYMYRQTGTTVTTVPGTDVGNAAQQLWWGTYEV